MSSPSGDLYATQLQVQRLEELVTKQQISLQELQQQNAFFSGGLPQVIEEQLQEAMKQRGSIGMDYAMVTKFVTKQIAHAIQQIHQENQKLLVESIPTQTLQTLERRLLVKPMATTDLGSLAERISHLESQKQQLLQQPLQAQDPQNPPCQQVAQIQELEAKLHHMETTLLAEIQRAYKTVYNPGDYAKPLAKLQATVERLDSEFQSFRSINFQESAMTMIKTAHQNLREEFQTVLETRASHDQLQRFEADVKRIEDFSKDVQTGFYQMKTRYEGFEQHLSNLFHEDRWSSLETKIHKSLDAKERQSQTQIQVALDINNEQVSTLLESAQTKIQKLEKEFNIQLGAEALQRHLQQIRDSIKETERTWFMDHAAIVDRKTQEMAEKVQSTRTHILELASNVKEELEGAQLQKRFQVFQDALQEQSTILKQQEEKNKAAVEASRQQVALMEAVQSSIFDEMAKVKQLTTGLQQVWKEEQEVIKKQVAADTRERRIAMEQVNQELQQQIQHLQDQIRVAETSLQTTLATQNEFTAEWKAEFAKAKAVLQDELANKTKTSDDYLIGRVAELSASLQGILQKAKDQQRDVESLLSQESIDALTTTVEKRIRTIYDEWSKRRTLEIGLKLGEIEIDLLDRHKRMEEKHQENWKTIDIENTLLKKQQDEQFQRQLVEIRGQTTTLVRDATAVIAQRQAEFESLYHDVDVIAKEYQEQISLEKGKERYAEFQKEIRHWIQEWSSDTGGKLYYKFDEYRKEITEAMRATSKQQEALEAMFSEERLQELIQNVKRDMKDVYEEWKFIQSSVIREGMTQSMQKYQEYLTKQFYQLAEGANESVKKVTVSMNEGLLEYQDNVAKYVDSVLQKYQMAHQAEMEKIQKRIGENVGTLDQRFGFLKSHMEESAQEWKTLVGLMKNDLEQRIGNVADQWVKTTQDLEKEYIERLEKYEELYKNYKDTTKQQLRTETEQVMEKMKDVQKEIILVEENIQDTEEILTKRIQELGTSHQTSQDLLLQQQKAITELRGLHRALSEGVRKVDAEAATRVAFLQEAFTTIENKRLESSQMLEEQLKRQAEKLQSTEDLSLSRIQQIQQGLQVSKLEIQEKVQTNNIFYTERLKQMAQTIQTEVGKHAATAEEKLQRLLERRLAPEHLQDLIRRVASKLQPQQLQFQNPLQKQVVYTRTFYTAIFGASLEDADMLAPFEPIPGWDAVCFTNLPLPPTQGWQIIQVSYDGTQYALEAKRYKWLSHKYILDYDVAVWLDGYIVPNKSQAPLLDSWLEIAARQDTPLLHRAHETRDCIYEECDAVIRYKKDTEENVAKVRLELEKAGMPHGWGLFDTNVMVRFHKKAVVQRLSEEIMEQLETTSQRDQLAVTLVYFKNQFDDYKVNSLLHAFQKAGKHVNHIV